MPFGDRQPLYRPLVANEVWSMDFVFDRTAEGRSLKCLTIVDANFPFVELHTSRFSGKITSLIVVVIIINNLFILLCVCFSVGLLTVVPFSFFFL